MGVFSNFESKIMQDEVIAKLLQRLKLAVPGKIIENSGFYSRVSGTNTAASVVFSSDHVTGEILHPIASGKGNTVIRGHKSESNKSKISFTGNNNIVFLGPHSRLNNADIRITCSDSILYFGAFSTVESMTVILSGDGGKIEIGDFCMLSARIIIDRSDHHSIYDTKTGQKINSDQDVVISDHVWISRDVRISKGSFVGKDSIIGQASLVTGSVKSGCAYGGVPARCLREDVTWSRMKAGSLDEMENSDRHKRFIKSVVDIKLRA